jgi:hypothetical protein
MINGLNTEPVNDLNDILQEFEETLKDELINITPSGT